MPGGDRTGPLGIGPMTGRGAGMCAGYDVPGYMNPASGRGFGGGQGRRLGRGFGMGGGRGWRHQYYATGLPGWARGYGYSQPYTGEMPVASGPARTSKAALNEELAYLKEQAQYLGKALEDIESRVKELQQDAGDDSNVKESANK